VRLVLVVNVRAHVVWAAQGIEVFALRHPHPAIPLGFVLHQALGTEHSQGLFERRACNGKPRTPKALINEGVGREWPLKELISDPIGDLRARGNVQHRHPKIALKQLKIVKKT
jgi:hypothetical protein